MIPTLQQTKHPKKWVIVSRDFSGLGFAKHLHEEGNEVLLATRPKDDEENLDAYDLVGEGIVDKISLDDLMDERKKYKDWYFLWDQNHNYEDADLLRKEGFKVFGGQELQYKMEHDRKFGTDIVAKAGLDTPPTHEFTSIQDGIDFLLENEDKAFVFKPDESEGAWTTYVPDNEDDHEANEELIRYMESQPDDGTSFILQERIKGLEYNVEMWVYKGKPFFAFCCLESKRKLNKDEGEMVGCSQDIAFTIPLESKIVQDTVAKLLPDFSDYTGFLDMNILVKDKKNYFLEFCFDDQTEIMTKDGWKLIKDVPIGTEVATLNRETHELEYQKTTDLIIQDYEGEMVSLGNGSIDAVMTPNHRQYVRKRKHFKKGKGGVSYYWDDVEAKDLKQGMVIKRDAKWKGNESSIYIVPEYIEKHYSGRQKFYFDIEHPAKTIAMDDWLQFLAFYLSEGSQDGYSVNISQYKFKKEMESVLSRLPFEYRIEKNGFRISSVQLAKHLLAFGKCDKKYIPDYVKELSPRQIRIFLDAYCLGDGSRHKRTGQVSYFTTSKKMSDDIQELILKAGSFANVKELKTKGTKMSVGEGKEYIRNHNIFSISERRERNELWLEKRHIGRKQYKGKVYCVTVPNHTIYVRRNGKAFWSANCARFGYSAHPNLFWNLAISPVSDILSDFIDGKTDDFYKHFRFGFGASITLYIDHPMQGLPFEKAEHLHGHFYHFDTYLDGEEYKLAGYANEVGIVTAWGYTITDAAKEALRLGDKIKYPCHAMRTDLDQNDYPSNPRDRYLALDSMGYLDKI